jgi:nucleotide-binding universal stress UspA family protein
MAAIPLLTRNVVMKILMAIDGSDCTKRMLARLCAREEMLGRGHDYTAMTVVPPIPVHAASFLGHDVPDRYYKEEAHRTLSPVVKFAMQNGWTLQTRSDVGRPGDLIAEEAARGKYDLIVMGTHGHTSVGNLVMGSVATQVIAHTKVPVLLIR